KSLVFFFQCHFRCPSLILYVFFTSTGIHFCNVMNTSSISMHIHPMTTHFMSANTICHSIKFNLRILSIFVKFVSLFDTFLSYELLLKRFYAYLNKLSINYARIIFSANLSTRTLIIFIVHYCWARLFLETMSLFFLSLR